MAHNNYVQITSRSNRSTFIVIDSANFIRWVSYVLQVDWQSTGTPFVFEAESRESADGRLV
jgi:hypothetical protein